MSLKEPDPTRYGWNWSELLGSQVELYWNQEDLVTLDAVLSLLKNKRVAVQAGACLGLFPRRLAEVFQTVFTFEPDVQLLRQAMRNAPAENIVWTGLPLGGPITEMVRVVRARRDGKPNHHEGTTHVQRGGVLPTLALDSLHLRQVDLVYLDVEGFEVKALQGARDLLRYNRPVVVVEVNRNIELTGHSRDELLSLMSTWGYDWKFSMRSDEVFVPR